MTATCPLPSARRAGAARWWTRRSSITAEVRAPARARFSGRTRICSSAATRSTALPPSGAAGCRPMCAARGARGRAMRPPGRSEKTLMIPFVKGHGLGNDYIVISEADLPGPIGARQIERICDRNWGAGSDGILLLVPGWDGADFGLRILNPDGSEAEKSGNGLRIFAKYLLGSRPRQATTSSPSTRGGRVECRCHVVDGRVNLVTVEMGRCTFVAAEIPMTGLTGEVVHVPLRRGRRAALTVTAVSVGNPHCVIFTERLDEALVAASARSSSTTPPSRTASTSSGRAWPSRSEVDILIWERGAGYTLASGSSSSAVACAAVKNGLCDHGLVTVRMPGGTLSIEVRPDWSIRLQGAGRGSVHGDLLARPDGRARRARAVTSHHEGRRRDGIRVLEADEGVHGAAHRLHEQARLSEREDVRGPAREPADALADAADHGGAQGQGEGARALEPLPAREPARRRAVQPRVRAPLRGHGPLAHRARGLQLLGARHRQHGGARPVRHRGAQEAVARAAARGRDPLGLRDDRAQRRVVGRHQHPGEHRARRRRVRDQRAQVVDVRHRRSPLPGPHLHGQDGRQEPGPLQAAVDDPGAARRPASRWSAC